jgi:hypothetical protein
VRLFEAIRAYGQPRVALERAVYFTESFRMTEGQPLVWRRAKALQHIAENISVASSVRSSVGQLQLITGAHVFELGTYVENGRRNGHFLKERETEHLEKFVKAHVEALALLDDGDEHVDGDQKAPMVLGTCTRNVGPALATLMGLPTRHRVRSRCASWRSSWGPSSPGSPRRRFSSVSGLRQVSRRECGSEG